MAQFARFGLRVGQIRGRDMVHNAGWYDRTGKKLGWGDLSPDDFRRISLDLGEGELFIVLSESDSFWNFVTRKPTLATKPEEKAPGIDYVAEKCAYILGQDQMYLVDRYGDSNQETVSRDGLAFRVLSRQAVRDMLEASAPTAE